MNIYCDVTFEGDNKGILITTRRLTDDAKRYAKGKRLRLIDGSEIQKLMKQYNL